MASESAKIRNWLHNHPKALGVLFALVMVLSQVGTVAAANGGLYRGP